MESKTVVIFKDCNGFKVPGIIVRKHNFIDHLYRVKLYDIDGMPYVEWCNIDQLTEINE